MQVKSCKVQFLERPRPPPPPPWRDCGVWANLCDVNCQFP